MKDEGFMPGAWSNTFILCPSCFIRFLTLITTASVSAYAPWERVFRAVERPFPARRSPSPARLRKQFVIHHLRPALHQLTYIHQNRTRTPRAAHLLRLEYGHAP